MRAPIEKKLSPLVQYLEDQENLISKRISDYSERWKQPINVDKTVIQLFHSQIKVRPIEVRMLGKKLKQMSSFKYLGFTWTSKLSLMPTVDKCLANIQKSLNKLKWLRCGHVLSTKTLRQCFFTYNFPHFSWLFPLYPSLPTTQRKALQRKYRAAIRLVHRAPYIPEPETRQLFDASTRFASSSLCLGSLRFVLTFCSFASPRLGFSDLKLASPRLASGFQLSLIPWDRSLWRQSPTIRVLFFQFTLYFCLHFEEN